MGKKTSDVFGVSASILPDSYVDRGHLDASITNFLQRDNHIAIRGASKSGKSWLRQSVIQNALVIQCRLGKTVEDIYREALGQLGVKLVVTEVGTNSLHGSVEAETEFGFKLLAKVKAKITGGAEISKEIEKQDLRQNISDLDFICALIRESGRRLVIEDFHYLSSNERSRLAFDLKAMWDLRLFVVLVGIWSDSNLLLNLNSDLTGRVREVSLVWKDSELAEILTSGASALNIRWSKAVVDELVSASYGSAGILQRLALDTLDQAGIFVSEAQEQQVLDIAHVHAAAMFYAEELNTVYQGFASNVSSGIRSRKNSTGIYAHAMAVVLDSDDARLLAGVPTNDIFAVAHGREPRIQLGNLKLALGNLERLQVDDQGRGLVLSFAAGKVRVVDHQLLLYRRFATVQWPWEDLIRQAEDAGEDFTSS